MPLLKNILGRIYVLYLLIMFVITIVLVAIPTGFCQLLVKDEKRKTAVTMNIYRVWMKIYLPLIFCPLSRKGLEHFREDENYVVVCNHNSFVDILVSTPSVPGANKTLAKKELARIPIFGLVYRSGSILVDRSDAQSRRKSLEAMKNVLEQGMHLVLYPEGTRNRSAQPIKPFYDGAFNVAIESGKPVMPALIFHTKQILPAGKSFYAWPHSIQMHFLPPVPTEGLTRQDIPALKEKVFLQMKEYYLQEM
jgi:1-acyl-sn-glycerol-3-phosphate acyltransferase